MKCPNDSATLVMSERSGVEIDYCPECRGVWLDRGELDKILDRAATEFAPAAAPAAPAAAAPPVIIAAPAAQQPYPPQQSYPPRTPQYGERDRGYNNRDGGYNNHYNQRPKKKESWLSDLFD